MLNLTTVYIVKPVKKKKKKHPDKTKIFYTKTHDSIISKVRKLQVKETICLVVYKLYLKKTAM